MSASRPARLGFVCAVLACAVAMSGCDGDGDGSVPSLAGFLIVTGGPSTVGHRGSIATTAACPSGKVVIGGGFSTANEGSNVHASFPTASGNGWTIEARNENFAGPTITMTPVAVCVDAPAGYEVQVAQKDVASGQLGTVSASCTDLTKRLIGGGFRSVDPTVPNYSSTFDPSVVSSTGVGAPTSWVSEFRSNHPIAASSSIRSFAICAANSAVSASYLASPTTTIGTQTNSTLTLSCDGTTPQTRVASGGVSADLSLANVYDSQPTGAATMASSAGAGWTSLVRNPRPPGQQSITAMLLLVCVAAS